MDRQGYQYWGIITLRWVARLWGFLLVLFALSELLQPDAVYPVSLTERLGPILLLGGAVLGFMLAWRWEKWGAFLYILGYLITVIGVPLLQGYWLPIPVILLMAVIFVTPGLAFLICYGLSQNQLV